MVVTGVESLFNFEPLKLVYCDVDVLVFPVYLRVTDDAFEFILLVLVHSICVVCVMCDA